MKYKDKVVSNLDLIKNHLTSIKIKLQNNSISLEQLIKEVEKLENRMESVSDMVGLEDNDFSALSGGIK